MKKYFIPEEKAVVQQQKDTQEINMQICIDRYISQNIDILWSKMSSSTTSGLET